MAQAQQTSWTEKDVRSATTIEPLQIAEEYVRMPGDLAYWNGQYADAQEGYLRAKLRREEGEARTRLRVRGEAELEGKRVTESHVDALVSTDPDYLAVSEQEIAAEVLKVKVIGVVDAIRAKRDMLISLGAHLRMEQDPQVNKDRKRG